MGWEYGYEVEARRVNKEGAWMWQALVWPWALGLGPASEMEREERSSRRTQLCITGKGQLAVLLRVLGIIELRARTCSLPKPGLACTGDGVEGLR